MGSNRDGFASAAQRRASAQETVDAWIALGRVDRGARASVIGEYEADPSATIAKYMAPAARSLGRVVRQLPTAASRREAGARALGKRAA